MKTVVTLREWDDTRPTHWFVVDGLLPPAEVEAITARAKEKHYEAQFVFTGEHSAGDVLAYIEEDL